MPDTEALETTDKPQLHKSPGPKNIPIETLLELRKKNLSYSQIASILNIHPKSVQKRLTPILQDIELTEKYSRNRVDILQYKQRQVLQYITPAKLAKESPSRLAVAYGILFDKERLESGKSTQNIAYLDMIKAKDRTDNNLEAIEAQLVDNGVDLEAADACGQTVSDKSYKPVDNSDNSVKSIESK